MSPTARSLKLLRDRGYLAEVVEKTIPKTFIKKDLWGCVDIIGIAVTGHIICVQATGDSGGNVAARVRKCRESEVFSMVKAGGHRFEVHGWKGKPNGKRKKWECRIEEL